MAYRTLRIAWFPDSQAQWGVFSAARREAGRLWSWLVQSHAEIRQHGSPWPTQADLQKQVKGLFPGLHSQSVQQTVADFCEAIASAQALRQKDQPFVYPHRLTTYRQVIFTNQAAKYADGSLSLPCGQAGRLRIRIPKGVVLPGRLIEVRLDYGWVEIVCQVLEPPRTVGATIGVDLGVNTLIAATDGQEAILISGREAKATVQWRNKRLAGIAAGQARKRKGSRRHKRLQRRKYRMLDKARNRIRDLCHKATRQVAEAFPNAQAYVGEPFNAACRRLGPRQAQTVASACNRKIIRLLNYKLAGAIEVEEAYSSQTCPVCGERSKHRRVYRCRCGYTAPRDVVACTNIRVIGQAGGLRAGCDVPNVVQWVHPSKYPGVNRVVPSDTGQVARE